MTLAIFLNNKLISCDTILPVAMEVHARTKRRVHFFTTDHRTFDAIRDNVVLWDGIHRIGRLVLLGSRSKNPVMRFLNKLRGLSILAPLAIAAKLGRARLLHFRALNQWPLNLLARFAPEAVFFCESDSYGENELMQRIAEVSAPRQRDTALPVGGALVAFQPKWVWLENPADRTMPRYVLGPTRTRKIWIDYIRDVSDAFHGGLFASAGEPDHAETLVFMLGYLGKLDYMRDAQTTQRLLGETLQILANESGGRPILLKPHVITDMSIVMPIVEALRRQGARIFIANLHPSVLATRARAFIANYYSTTLADAFSLGVPTIEYTDYSVKALEVTAGGSMRPDYVSHYISNDPPLLRSALQSVLASRREPLPQGIAGDPSGLIDTLSGQAPATGYHSQPQGASWRS
jgi:hypothetical protein